MIELRHDYPFVRAGVVIDTTRRTRGNNDDVPQVLTPEERYEDFQRKFTAVRGTSVNAFPWAWRGKKKPKTFLSKKPRQRKRRMETVPA